MDVSPMEIIIFCLIKIASILGPFRKYLIILQCIKKILFLLIFLIKYELDMFFEGFIHLYTQFK